MDPVAVIDKYYRRDSLTRKILMSHSRQVARKALEVGRHIGCRKVDLEFISQAAMLHDIGIIRTATAQLGCYGAKPYVCHGELGARMLEECGLPLHARVCRCHVGVGLEAAEIIRRNLPLPPVDVLPESLEEKIICYADKFFSKNKGRPREKSIHEVIAGLARWGQDKVERFVAWHLLFSGQKLDLAAVGENETRANCTQA